jgi:hypothetical protein
MTNNTEVASTPFDKYKIINQLFIAILTVLVIHVHGFSNVSCAVFAVLSFNFLALHRRIPLVRRPKQNYRRSRPNMR